MKPTLDIEQPRALIAYLRANGRIGLGEEPTVTVLAGGVSNRTVRVDRPQGDSWVLKQALAQLRVKEEWYSDPARIRRESLGLQWIGRLVPWETVPGWLFEDPANDLLAMEAVPQPHENWKTRLLNGHVELEYAAAFGRLLGVLHTESNRRRAELPSELEDRSFFETLRLEPYYQLSAQRNAVVARALRGLMDETWSVRCCLVHGDFSPKNVLIRQGRLVLLDHEVIHLGDPAFDLGFALTHFLSKARHRPRQRVQLFEAASRFWDSYRQAAPVIVSLPGLESRAVRHTLACLLARVDGRSPLEYLTAEERKAQREQAVFGLRQPPETLGTLLADLSLGSHLRAGAGIVYKGSR
jgi:5-methylthioribose kinase